MSKFLKRTPFITEDGSASLRLDELPEHYHSMHGAYRESMHIYIKSGLHFFPDFAVIKILEMGFGTGLNAALTLCNKGNRLINYHTIEAYPLTLEEVGLLNYKTYIGDKYYSEFLSMHSVQTGEKICIDKGYEFTKTINTMEHTELEGGYQLIYYDAFGPEIQPELWTAKVFDKLYAAMASNSILVTYCAKGSVKRNMKAAGFEVESLEGPPGKREITRCFKK